MIMGRWTLKRCTRAIPRCPDPDGAPILDRHAVHDVYQEYLRLGDQAKPFPLLTHRVEHYSHHGLVPRAAPTDDR